MNGFVIFLFLFLASYGQTGVIKGIVKKIDGKKISDVYIYNNEGKGTFTDSKGRFTLVLDSGKHTLFFEHTSYLLKEFSIVVRKNKFTTVKIILTCKKL